METAADAIPKTPTFRQALAVWVKIGFLGFGGPAGQIALMHKMLVEERRWISDTRFLHALNYCMLLPGPEAQQLATYIGWLMHRTLGGLAAGLLFVLPGAAVMLVLSTLYVLYGTMPEVAAAFYGIKAAVLAIVIGAVVRIGKRALTSRFLIIIAALAFIAIYGAGVPFPLIIGLAALAGAFVYRLQPDWLKPGANGHGPLDKPWIAGGVIDRMFTTGQLAHAKPSVKRLGKTVALWLPLWLLPVILLVVALGPGNVWSQIALFFSVMAAVTFGGAYAVLSYVAQEAVQNYGWLTAGEMLDGLGLAETTPGPLILVLQHVGYLAAFRNAAGLDPVLAGSLAALLTLWVTFAPCFLWIFAGAPYMEALRENKVLAASLSAVTAAVVGVILNLAIWFALHVVFGEVREWRWFWLSPDIPVLQSLDWRALLLSVSAAVAALYFKLSIPLLIAIFAGAGLLTV
jgi:chromate transporter